MGLLTVPKYVFEKKSFQLFPLILFLNTVFMGCLLKATTRNLYISAPHTFQAGSCQVHSLIVAFSPAGASRDSLPVDTDTSQQFHWTIGSARSRLTDTAPDHLSFRIQNREQQLKILQRTQPSSSKIRTTQSFADYPVQLLPKQNDLEIYLTNFRCKT